MVMHWESSQRPLYVKTVWRDGQHHVILDKNKELTHEFTPSFRKQKSTSKNPPSRRSSKSATIKSSTKMLLSNVGRFKSVDHQWKPSHDPDLMVKPLSGRPMTSCNEMMVKSIKTSRLPRLKTESGGMSSKSFYIESSRVLDNPLSEKVLVWLDLAVQSGNLSKKLNPVRLSHTPEPDKIYLHTSKNSSKTCTPREIFDASILKQPPEFAASGEVIVFSKQEKDTVEDDFYHVLTPRIEDQNVCNDIMEDKKNGCITKRQLHIFMPNLPKKTSDCDSSLLSSIISSSFAL